MDFDKVFEDVDVLLAPTVSLLPCRLSEIDKLVEDDIALQLDFFTQPLNLAGKYFNALYFMTNS